LKTVGNIAKEAIKAGVIDAQITWVSNNGYPVTKHSNWVPVIGHPHDHAPIPGQIGAQRTNDNQEFFYRYNYYYYYYCGSVIPSP